jgi:2-oxoglutarate dehydrogenase complex dehydrogenase (E1) component-like enzyme
MNTLPFHGPNAGYVAELHDRWLADPASVDSDTAAAFERGAIGHLFDDKLPAGIDRAPGIRGSRP